MGLDQFDKQIKDKLQFHQAEVDPILWDKIEAHLPKKNKNRFAPLFWIVSGVALISTSALTIYLNQNKNTTTDKNIIIADTPAASNTSSQLKESVAHSLTSVDDATLEVHANNELPEIIAKEVKQSTVAQTTNLISPVLFPQKVESDIADSDKTMARESSAQPYNSKILADLRNINTYRNSFKTLESNSKNGFSSKKVITKDNCLEGFSVTGRGIILEAFYGNDFPIRHMKAKNETFAGLVKARKETESPLYSYSLGGRLGFNVIDDFKIYTGAYYSQVNEKFEYVDPESSQTTVVKTTIYIKDGQGNVKDSTFTFDTIYTPGTLIYKIKNQYTSIDLPILVGFHAIKGEKIDVHLNVGILANLVFQKNGMALVDESYSVRNFNDSRVNTFNNSLGISSYIGAQFLYKWKSDLHFFIEPNVRIQHRGLTSKDYPIAHKYTIVSFFTGVAYNF